MASAEPQGIAPFTGPWLRRAAAVALAVGTLSIGALSTTAARAAAASPGTELPRVVHEQGRHALLVDGAPFLVLGAQANNSSNHVDVLPAAWQTLATLHANTLEMPVSWQQVEPVEGQFRFDFVDALLAGARGHGLRVVVLWFGAFKNGGPGYAPEWVRADTVRFPRKRDARGEGLAPLSPLAASTLAADSRAFAALMRHLAAVDARHTVILVQVENEPGAFGIPREHSAGADRLFEGGVPRELVDGLHRTPGTWRQVFGALAEAAFTGWHTARYVDAVAAAGKSELALPMYCNSALSDPFASEPDPAWVSSGSPDWNMIDLWKVAAPHLDFVAPDIYSRDAPAVFAWLDAYRRDDNALFVPEIGNAADYARFFWAALGRGAIGFAPFGMDATGYVNYPLGAKVLDDATLEAFAADYRAMAPHARGWARLAATHAGWGTARGRDGETQAHDFGAWRIDARYGRWLIGDEGWTFVKADVPPWKAEPVGGLAVLALGEGEFLVAGSRVRVGFSLAAPRPGQRWQYLSVEEVAIDDAGRLLAGRPWNGDQVDYGLNLPAEPVLLHVRLGTWQ